MAKGLRSRWKKSTRRIKAQNMLPKVQERIEKLHAKLQLSAKRKLGRNEPMQERTGRFSFSAPKLTGGQPLVLEPIKTRIVRYGAGIDHRELEDRLHPQHPSKTPASMFKPSHEHLEEEEGEVAPDDEFLMQLKQGNLGKKKKKGGYLDDAVEIPTGSLEVMTDSEKEEKEEKSAKKKSKITSMMNAPKMSSDVEKNEGIAVHRKGIKKTKAATQKMAREVPAKRLISSTNARRKKATK